MLKKESYYKPLIPGKLSGGTIKLSLASKLPEV